MESNELPTEVLSLILGQLIELRPSRRGDPTEDKKELAKARLHHSSSRARDDGSSYDTDESDEKEKGHFKTWESLMNVETIRQNARRAIIKTCPDPSDSWQIWHDWKKNGEYPRFYHAINRINELPNINSLNIHFSEGCVGREGTEERNSWQFELEPMATRQMTLSTVFDAIRRRAEDKSAATIRSLVIENLQNTTVPGLDWEAAARDIKELHLITEEYNEHGPDRDVYLEERRTFEPHLQMSILPHFAQNLTALTLGFQESWGTMPGYFDGKGLAFPQLKTLNLINFVISNHAHFKWVLSQASLETLRLDSCHIVSHIHIDVEDETLWGPPTYDWEQYPKGAFDFTQDHNLVYFFSGTWETVFDQIRVKLPKLTQFKFDWSLDERFHCPEALGARLFPNRYIAFDSGVLPSPWMGAAKDDGEMEFGDNDPSPFDRNEPEDSDMSEANLNRAKETEAGDARAFDELLATVSARRWQST